MKKNRPRIKNEWLLWLFATGKILVRPLPSTFQELAEYPNIHFALVIVWLVGAELVAFAADWLLGNGVKIVSLISGIFIVPLTLLIWVFCIHTLYLKMFHRKMDRYMPLLFVMAASLMASEILSVLMVGIYKTFLPQIGPYLVWINTVYLVVLIVIAACGVLTLKLWQSVVATLLGALMAGLLSLLFQAFTGGMLSTMPRLF